MLRTLLRRNVALMVGVVLAGQLLAGLLVLQLVMRPQVERVANVTADMIAGLSQVVDQMPDDRRRALIMRIEQGGDLAIREGGGPPRGRLRFPNFIERQFIRALTDRLAAHGSLAWRTGDDNRLWFSVRMGSHDYWISVTPRTRRGALSSLVLAMAAALVIALACGILLQRRLDAPLRRLAEQVDARGSSAALRPVDVSGPAEVAAVAGAFNRMTERLRFEEAERSLMLASVSHDLRTPLTRLRLCLEMMHCDDAELERTAARQVDRIEAMLEQFLDFARGFADEPVQRVDVTEILAHVRADYPRLILDIAPGLVVPLRRGAVSRALGNLVGNAVNHGVPPVSLRAREVGECVEFSVGDAGYGFPPEQEAQLLRPFARGDSARGGDGAGLGLAIAQRVAQAHGGTLRFERRDGTFCAVMRLPIN